VYDRCNGIIQCRDGSDERNCPTDGHSAASNEEKELVSSLTSKYPLPSNAEEIVRSKELDQLSNSSQSTGVEKVGAGFQNHVDFSGRSSAAGDGSRDADSHLRQMDVEDSVAGSEASSAGGNTYEHRETSGSAAGHDSGGKPGRLAEEEVPGDQKMLADGKVAESGKMSGDGEKVADQDAILERGHLLLSAMVDKSEVPKHVDSAGDRYAEVESERKPVSEADHSDSYGNMKDGGGYSKVVHRKPIFGNIDPDRSIPPRTGDQTHRQPVDYARYGTGDEVRRLRKPDLSRVDAPSSDSRWSPGKSASYQYDSSSSGKFGTEYVRANSPPHTVESELPSSRFSSSNRIKNYGNQASTGSSGSGLESGEVRAGLTEARPAKQAVGKSRDRGSDTDGFLSNQPLNSQFERHDGSQFRSHSKPSYDRGVGAPPYEGAKRTGLVADQSRYPSNGQYPSNRQYPSNSRDVLYGDSFYPAAADDYYYVGGAPGRGAGYDPQAPVDYDYYNMAPGLNHITLVVIVVIINIVTYFLEQYSGILADSI